MTIRNTKLKPLILMLFLCANSSHAVIEGQYVGKFNNAEAFRLETLSDWQTCRYQPVINGVSMGWFDGVLTGDINQHTCSTKNHGEIGKLWGFNNQLIGSGDRSQ